MNPILQFCTALAVAVAGGVVASAPSGQSPDSTPAAQDAYPNGCVSCHVATDGGKDRRLSTLLAAVEGHPGLGIVSAVPADCGKCHKAGSKIEGSNTLMHRVHYGGLEKSEFLSFVQGSCFHCHSMDPKSGKITVKAGPKNW